jgi:hypothetical protein
MVERLALLFTDHRVLMNQADGLLFPGRVEGKPLAHGPMTKRWRDRWEKAGLRPLGLHEARHTRGTSVHRRRPEREDGQHLPRARKHRRHLRPLRPRVPRGRARGSGAARRVLGLAAMPRQSDGKSRDAAIRRASRMNATRDLPQLR